ncbi:hypothetical protein B296_00053712 [Ensete ventricosum]|uniref:Uncharacterized protein n=1 Tax=Ensete ventricosum TaxID=4639 RepID=A0A426Y6S4_ENSVE|nr:hypothetical protein B296_00053712 [Ensete ventricosum]
MTDHLPQFNGVSRHEHLFRPYDYDHRRCDDLPVSKTAMEFDDELVLFHCEATTLAAPQKAGRLGERAPGPLSMGTDVCYEEVVFLLSPRSSFDGGLLTATETSPLLPSPNELAYMLSRW